MPKIRTIRNKILLYCVLIVVGFICLFPYLWLVSSAFKPLTRIFAMPPDLIPRPITLVNFYEVLTKSPFLKWLWNSTYITLIVVVLGSFVASMAGFAFAKLRFRGSSILFLLPLFAMLIPNEVIVIPLFKIWSAIKLVDTHVPLITPNIIGAGGMFGVFLFRQFYLSVPYELVEAAKIDGCSPFGIYFLIMLPMSQSPLATLAIWNFVNTWNDFLDPLIYLNTTEKYTLALGLSLYTDSLGPQWGQIMAACLLATLPLIILFFSAQKKFIESVALTGMKA